MNRRSTVFVLLMLLLSPGCATATDVAMPDPGVPLRDCPTTPNCVASAASDAARQVAGFTLRDPQSWQQVRSVVAEMPRMRVIRFDDTYLHAEETSRVFKYVDDLELHREAGSGRIAVRSASRVGSWDLGVNRRRVERLRSALRERGLIE